MPVSNLNIGSPGAVPAAGIGSKENTVFLPLYNAVEAFQFQKISIYYGHWTGMDSLLINMTDMTARINYDNIFEM